MFLGEGLVGVKPKAPIVVYTDGASLGNPGPAGIGIVLRSGRHYREIAEPLGVTTNNVAELTAILRALEAIRDPNRPVFVHTDSEYAIGVLTRDWKPKKNRELIARIRRLLARFPEIRFVKVAGHSGDPDNERCDELAKEAAGRVR